MHAFGFEIGQSAAVTAWLAAVVLTLLLAAPSFAAATPWPTASWQTSTPEQQGMSSRALADLINAVGTRKQDSLLVERHGRIVAT